jgi:ribosome-associated protein
MTNRLETVDEPERPSKSQRKREMTALQALGARLVALGADQLRQIELPERLLEAVLEAQRISNFEGRRRQMQYIGKLMRDIDPSPIRATLDRQHGATRGQIALHRAAEDWRDRLLAGDAALTGFIAEFPDADAKQLRALIASVRHDRAAGKAPKNFRALFRAVHAIVAKKGVTAPDV